MIHDSILDTIGRTPIVRINRLAPKGVTMYVKVEAFNPMASVKDRLALAIILDAEARGALKPGQTVVEATSGNTGIALAMVCAARGYPFVAIMADSFSIERRKLMRALGAKVLLSPAAALVMAAFVALCSAVSHAHKVGALTGRNPSDLAAPAFAELGLVAYRQGVLDDAQEFTQEAIRREWFGAPGSAAAVSAAARALAPCVGAA